MDTRLEAFNRLLDIMDDLREKCPWDRKQTIESLRHLTIEETYELADAIADGDMKGINEELGDILLHIVFYAKIGSEQKQFDITSVINGVCNKLINRHPHIYGDVQADTEEQVKENWEKLKLKEGKTSVLEGVPKTLPSLVKAWRIQDKAKQVGFEWETKEQVWDKVEEEIAELKEAVSIKKTEQIEEEFGDLMFAMINYARFLQIDPEMALEKCNKKFIKRFQYIEKQARKSNRDLKNMTLAEMDGLWNESKNKL